MLERTLSIIKPDAVAAGRTGKILAMIEEAGFRILALRMLRLRREQAEAFYDVHRGKHFYESLVRFMTEGPVVVIALERADAVARLRDLMGPTDPAQAGEGTIRKLYGSNIERNAIHGSDAPDTAERELRFFFSTSELV
ncbi:MAG TPA: nucleoside-diphosphate kinase [Bryobacteraceae bacterium]|nr:nucleoside-diphosphate kinase [Bryobacteraceae bacterium]